MDDNTKKITFEVNKEDHSRIKVEAGRLSVSLRHFIMMCVKGYFESQKVSK